MDKPANAEERNLLIVSTLELIERTNKAIAVHQSYGTPDKFSIDQYRTILENHLAFLTELMQDLGVEAHLSIRQAA
ncbi:hypothetical protein [Larkinella sp.]|uniref:hypothetical protein n=1 Tax=Larkinella sp. TaxID=2034517 RepID=UPI003BA944A2